MQARKSTTRSGSNTSNKAQKSAHCSSPSASATMERGFESFTSKMRSPLRSPLGLPLLVILNGGNEEKNRLPENLQHLYKEDKEALRDARVGGAAYFERALEKWDGKKETHFTDNLLLKELEEFWEDTLKPKEATGDSQESVPIKIAAQTYITGANHDLGGQQKGEIDILLSERSAEDPTKGLPLCTMEFGVKGHYTWWQKLCQGAQYLAMMRDPKKNGGKKHHNFHLYHFGKNHPVLLCPIIVNKDDEGNVSGDFGILLCVPASCNDFRYILLWRKRIENNLKGVADAFGKVTMASYALHEWRKKDNEQSVYGDFKYLGPNCAKFGNQLYRSYDNRVRATERSPSLYLEEYVEAVGAADGTVGGETVGGEKRCGFHWYPGDNEQTLHKAAEVVLELSDGGEGVLGFGELLPEELQDRPREWLWENRGKLWIISVPFRNGGHQATKISDFQPIFDHLVHLHKHGMVHGDIRAFNMVFENNQGSEKKGWLIDLDFGGKVGEKKYPQGFVAKPGDGTRLGKGGEPIEVFDDYYALWQTIDLYCVPSDHFKSEEDEDKFLAPWGRLGNYFERGGAKFGKEAAQEKLRAFLEKNKDKPLEPKIRFELEPSPPKNEKNKNIESESPHKNGETNKAVATGSLP